MVNQSVAGNEKSELDFAMVEIELLIAYVSRIGIPVKSTLIKSSLQSRKEFQTKGGLSATGEAQFWTDYNQLIGLIKPATLTSIQHTSPSPLWAERNHRTIRQVKCVPWYYGTAVFVIILITVVLQSYYMIGVDVLNKTSVLFEKRNKVRIELKKETRLIESNNSEASLESRIQLQQKETMLDQKFDANRILLFQWNGVWKFGEGVNAEFSHYDNYIYSQKVDRLHQDIVREENRLEGDADLIGISDIIRRLKLESSKVEVARQLGMSRNLFFRNQLQAEYMLNLLSGYALPLLFGCLGAFTLVLRSIHSAFQQGTFTLKHRLDYNLRVVLGGVMGISSGLFFGEDQAASVGQYSPMMIAFLIGYNVEILFSMMDNLANRLAIESKASARKGSKSIKP
ncbi:hypothetical protein A9Q99_07355 [Gammaproteobacteria bacterium 45_16_T64]|nr:hypothetical protein A9Q99_07355 [Gammaproteobacteria bacterium 45_16_T64]